MTPVPFTDYPGFEYSPAFSPDGSQIAFAWSGDPAKGAKGDDLYVKVINSENLLRLTQHPSELIWATWSPDGLRSPSIASPALIPVYILFPHWVGLKESCAQPKAALVRHLGQPLLIVWDRLPAHRSRLVQDYIASLQGWISTAYLPPYAPELNPVEYIWGYWKQHELPNVCPKDYWQLSEAARRTLRRMRRRPRLITAFWKQSSLWS